MRSQKLFALTVIAGILVAAPTACRGKPAHDSALQQRPPIAAEAGGVPPVALDRVPLAPAPPPPELKRDIVTTASLTVVTAATSAAADQATQIAEQAGGRIDSRAEEAGSTTGRASIALTLRVPASKLDGIIGDLKRLGTVQSLEIKSEDVTATRVDLDARMVALQTSIERLLAIMRDAKDADALVKAEDALTKRQADLDSLRAQRTLLGEQIAYSTINLNIYADKTGGPTLPRYHGFFGQVERGWDTVTAVAWNAVLLVGLLVPWFGVLAVLLGVMYWLRRARKKRHR